MTDEPETPCRLDSCEAGPIGAYFVLAEDECAGHFCSKRAAVQAAELLAEQEGQLAKACTWGVGPNGLQAEEKRVTIESFERTE